MSPRLLAVGFTLLMLVGGIPPATATHTDGITPDLPGLPHAEPTQECLPVGIQENVLERLNQAMAGDPAFYQDDVGAPAICVDGGPLGAWQQFIHDADSILENLRNASKEVQDQVNYRLEGTLPDSTLPDDLIQPRTVLLNETFNGFRTGGFGDWQIVTERGEDPLFSFETVEDANATRTGYRFGHEDGYAQGAHQFLVSPEIDLTALKGNKTAVRDLVSLRDQARQELRFVCNDATFVGPPQPGQGALVSFCGSGTSIGTGSGGSFGLPVDVPGVNFEFETLFRAYEDAFDDAIMQLPVMRHAAFLELTYRFNMAPGEDGVRLWVYSGDRQPDRLTLFQDTLGLGADNRTCVHYALQPPTVPEQQYETIDASAFPRGSEPESLTCAPSISRGQVVTGLPGMQPTLAFNSLAENVPTTAWSGDMQEFQTVRLNLTDYAEQRIWILFEVATRRNDRGIDIFNDTSRFARQEDYGFQLTRVYAEGDGYHRNFRLKDVAATYPYEFEDNQFGDPNTTRTTLPPGHKPVVAWVHNAGDYLENGTLRLSVSARSNTSSGSFESVGSYTTNVSLRPDEVESVVVQWGSILTSTTHPTLREGWLYRVNGELTTLANGTGTLGDQVEAVSEGSQVPLADPNTTRVQPANAAGLVPGAGSLEVTQDVRAATLREVALLRADQALGNPILLCSKVDLASTAQMCTEHYAGRKGEPREVLVGVRNDGNTAQNVTLELSVMLDGAAKPDTVLGGTTRIARDLLPGEVRAITWTVVATQPGAYDLVVSAIREGQQVALDPNAERKLFVQRSTGLICLDTLEERECGSSFTGEIVPTLRLENVTASALGPDGTLYAATEIREAEGDLHSGLLAARSPDGEWRVLANLSATVLNTTFNAPPVDGYAYGPIRAIVVDPAARVHMVGDNGTILRLTGSTLERIPLRQGSIDAAEAVNLTSALWYKGELLAAGTNGTLARFGLAGATDAWMERFTVSNATHTPTGSVTFNGTFHAAALAPNGHAVLVGDRGVMMRHDPSKNITQDWKEVALGTTFVAFGIENATLRTVSSAGGRLVVTGDDVFLASRGTRAADTFVLVNRTLPPPVEAPQTFVAAASGNDGRLYLLDAKSRVATCDGCFTELPSWTYVTPVRPSVVGKGAVHPAAATLLVSDGTRTSLLGEAGAVLDLAREGPYDNFLDWTTVPTLAPRDGGVLETRRDSAPWTGAQTSAHQEILLIPDDEGRALAQQATQFRVFLNHSVNWTTAGRYGIISAVYRPVPDFIVQPASGTGEPTDTCPSNQQGVGAQTSTLATACRNPAVRVQLWNFSRATDADGWEFKVFPTLPAAGPVSTNPLGTSDPVGTWFFGIEIGVTPGIRWSIDDLRVQAEVASKWVDVAGWYGPEEVDGSLFVEDPHALLREVLGENYPVADIPPGIPNVPNPNTDDFLENAIGTTDEEQQWDDTPFAYDLDTLSPWHVSTEYADRPVFAANNEFYKDGHSDPASPILFNNWDARLVSPVIDLEDAYDPVISWRHAYSFRTSLLIENDGADQTVQARDGGFVEVQYLRRGPDCGVNDLAVTCGWSPFYPVTPDGGYPTRDDLGFEEAEFDVISDSTIPPYQGRIGENFGEGVSYWGRQSKPDATNRVSGTRLTETYVPASVHLGNATCTRTELDHVQLDADNRVDCVPVNLTSRLIRVAFHIQTGGDWKHLIDGGFAAGESQKNLSDSSAGEGWYITDFKVLGAKTLGIDLRAKDLELRVGYDHATIGVGPGTRVPVNVTVDNRGAFEALGYTGRLEVREVTDRANKVTTLVDTIPLSQQPLLDVGKTVNHTIFWTVPGKENAEYALTFVLEPIGIDRDEDHLDNVAELGTTAQPIRAKTVRQYTPEFLVSPENATSDITRFIPMYINNTGNVPLDGFTIERRIVAQGRTVPGDATTCQQWLQRVADGSPSAIVDCRQWTTQRAAPPGALTPITLLSDEVNPTSDLFWKAPERSTFLVSLSAKTQVGNEIISRSSDRRVAAFATYLFDDVEGGLRGDSKSGNWVFGPAWNSSQPGFRSTDAYSFGEPLIDRYPADANSALVTPTIDLGSARTARLALYHNFAFEPGFDGGVIEASDDGGKTWTAITPIDHKQTSASYNVSFPIQPSNPLHPNGDPDVTAYGFTHDSANLPASVDGWVLTQLDLTKYANVSEADVEYEAYHALELGSYGLPPFMAREGTTNLYLAGDWCPGSFDDAGCWSFENLTQGTIVAPSAKPADATENVFMWSGSGSKYDDNKRPIQNHIMKIDIDLTAVASDQLVLAEWWEYASRFDARTYYYTSDSVSNGLTEDQIYTYQTFQPSGGVGPETYRFNLGEARIIETRGEWYRMQADLTPLVPRLRADNKNVLEAAFAYTPIKEYGTAIDLANAQIASGCTPANAMGTVTAPSGCTPSLYFGRTEDDRGFAIDDFSVKAYRIVGGQPQGDPLVILDEAAAWEQVTSNPERIRECGRGDDTLASGTPSWAQGNQIYPGCFNGHVGPVSRQPVLTEVGTNWNLVTEATHPGGALPGVPSSWRVVDVKDEAGYVKPSNLLPTGDVPKAWYSGDIANPCRDHPTAEAADVEARQRCPHAGSEARLITPAFDLGTIAGEDAQLSFWHRFAFYQRNPAGGVIPLASGGVVEISILDAQTGEWSDWKQMYSTGDLCVDSALSTLETKVPRRDGTRGGYTGVTANVSRADAGVLRYDPPFDNVVPMGADCRDASVTDAVQFLYTGNSTAIEQLTHAAGDGAIDGWIQERFDVTEHLGKKVRFGFHYAYSPMPVGSQDALFLDNPDGSGPTGQEVDGRSGWWIKDVAVVGDVLVGKPVQLRFRAGTDGNVHEGHWLLDDIGVFGARYRNNVGIFVDDTPQRYGAYANSVTTVPVTVRNMGETVRRDLALEVRAIDEALTVTGVGPTGNLTGENGELFLTGITLGPGQSAVLDVKVHTPKSVTNRTSQIILQLREENPLSPTDPFVAITNNEVQGILTRMVDFTLQREGRFNVTAAAIQQVTPRLHEPVDLVLTGWNPGFGPVTLTYNCTARSIVNWGDANHEHTDTESPEVVGTYPCSVSGDMSLAAKEWTNLTVTATPTKAGFLSFEVRGAIVGHGNVTPDQRGGVSIGVPITAYRETFDRRDDLNNFTGHSTGMQWTHTRGHDGLGALLLGINETKAEQGASYQDQADGCAGTPCFARSPAIDLHNFTEGTPAFLSFWHLDRFARYDGAQVRARVLLNEAKPTLSSSWSSEPCILEPLDGFEGKIRRKLDSSTAGNDGGVQPQPGAPPDGDGNTVFTVAPYDAMSYETLPGQIQETPKQFFITPNGLWEESWSLAVFELPALCQGVKGHVEPLLGRTIRLEFELYPGFSPSGSLTRGNGHGWIIDDITISPIALSVRPETPQRAAVLDDTTKAFNVVLENEGALPDVVTLRYDALNSSAPDGSVQVPTETYTLMPGETRTVAIHVTLPRDPSLLPTDFKVRILAQSLLDPNAIGASTVDLAFGPRQWPELALDVESPAGIVQEATETFIPITIENNGLVDSLDTRVRIVDTWAGGVTETFLDVPSMPSYAQAPEEASRVLEFRWRPERGSIGEHTLTFEVDPDGLLEEYTKTNNLATIRVPVSDLLIPDLHVANLSALTLRNAVGGTVTAGLDADVARYEVTAGEVVSFELRVANKGRAGATNVDVRAFIGALSLPQKTIPFIAPGTEAVVTFNWLAQKGEHEIEFVVRNEQVELTSTNNRYPGVGVTLLTVKGYEIAVDIPGIEGILPPSSEILVPFSITNDGNAGEDLVLVAKTPSGMRLMLPREGFFLRAGETYSDHARLILDAEAVAGQQFISIDAIARENPMKVASGSAPLSVLASYGGSIAGGYAVGAPPELVIPVELVNEGNSIEPWKLTLRLPAGWTAAEAQPALVPVPAHDRVTYHFHVRLPESTAPGDRVFAVKAEMPNGETREGVARVGVLPLRSAQVKVQEDAPQPDKGSLAIPVRITNTGNVQQPFSVVLIDPPAGVEMRVEPAEFLLPPGGVAIATLIMKPNASVEAGTYAISGYTRFEGVIPQTREGLANVQTLRVPIVRQDLKLSALELSPRADVGVGDRVTVKASLQNLGQFAVANVPVHLFADDVFLGEVLVPTLAPGQRTDVTFNWTAVPGVHTLTAVVDPYEDTVDADREDNAVASLASVGTNVAEGGIAAGRADTPMGGAWLVVTALAAAIMLTRAFGSRRRERR